MRPANIRNYWPETTIEGGEGSGETALSAPEPAQDKASAPTPDPPWLTNTPPFPARPLCLPLSEVPNTEVLETHRSLPVSAHEPRRQYRVRDAESPRRAASSRGAA